MKNSNGTSGIEPATFQFVPQRVCVFTHTHTHTHTYTLFNINAVQTKCYYISVLTSIAYQIFTPLLLYHR